MVSFDALFSKTLISKSFIWAKGDAADKAKIETNMGIPVANIDNLLTFYRYTTLEVTFGGFQ